MPTQSNTRFARTRTHLREYHLFSGMRSTETLLWMLWKPTSGMHSDREEQRDYLSECIIGRFLNNKLFTYIFINTVQQVELFHFKKDDQGNAILDRSETVPIVEQEHTSCSCECKIQAEHCTGLQAYDADNCACYCRNSDDFDKCERVRLA